MSLFVLVLFVILAITFCIICADLYLWRPTRLRLASEIQSKSNLKFTCRPLRITMAYQLFFIVLVVVVLRSFFFESYKVPTESMHPTILVGSSVLVNKYEYGLYEPLFRNLIIKNKDPMPNDVAVFALPGNPGINFVKRVVGVPGDKIIIDHGVLSVVHESTKTTLHGISNDGVAGGYFIQEGMKEGEWLVPKGQYFVLGDNSDNSQDSRYWGFVPRGNFVGKVVGEW